MPVAVVLTAAVIGCSTPPMPDVESPRLSDTDLAVMRTVLESVIGAQLDGQREEKGAAIIIPPTRTITHAPKQEPPRKLPPPPPNGFPDPFGVSTAASQVYVPPSPYKGLELYISDDIFRTANERIAWRQRNQLARDIPDLAVPGFSVMRRPLSLKADLTVTMSTPAYVNSTLAIVYADFLCGGTCGEGWLIWLTRLDDGTWDVTRQIMLWIS
jgi:hypothetical protein